MTCEQCGKEIALDEIRFCPFCGSQLHQRPEERRQAIIIFGDVSGFTKLSQEVDPDVLRSLIDELMKKFVSAVENRGGVVDKIIGDCIMCVFGTERTSSDDPRRAMETVEDLRQETEIFNQSHQLNLSLHFGVAFGTVSVGVVGKETTVMGDPVNLASRLLTLAGTSEVLVSEEFTQLLSQGYEFARLSETRLKGFDQPVTPFKYLGRTSSAPSKQVLLGRKKEIAFLQKHLEELGQEGKSQQLLLFGNAGIGKTELSEWLREAASQHQMGVFSIYFEEGGVGVLSSFQNMVQRVLQRPEFQAAEEFALWHQVLKDEKAQAGASSELLETLLTQLVENALNRKPALLFLSEDLHRAEPSARLLYKNLMERFASRPVFFLTTSRLNEKGYGDPVEIGPLSTEETRELFTRLIPKADLEGISLAEVMKHAGGNPFLVHAFARALERGIPQEKLFSGTVELLLASTLDSFALEDQELIKQASMFGSRVPLEYLARLSDREVTDLKNRLERSGLVSALAGEEILVFRHDLIRASAYKRINRTIRRNWHGRIGAILEGVQATPEEVAYHYLHSDEKDQALAWAVKAGSFLTHLPRKEEALYFLHTAQDLALQQEDAWALGKSLTFLFEVESRGKSISEALEIIQEWENDDHLLSITGISEHLRLMKGSFYFERGKYQEASAEIEALQGEVEGDLQVEVNLLHGKVLTRLGKHQDVVRIAMQALQRGEEADSRQAEFLNLLGAVSYLDEELEQSAYFYDRALQLFEKQENLQGVQKTLLNLGNIRYVQGEYERARDRYSRSVKMAFRFGDLVGLSEGQLKLALANFRGLAFADAMKNCRQAISILGHGRNDSLLGQVLMALASIHLYLEDLELAAELQARVEEVFQAINHPFERGRSYLARAELSLHQEKYDEALQEIEKALPLLADYPKELIRALLVQAEIFLQAQKLSDGLACLQKVSPKLEHSSPRIQAKYLYLSSGLEKQNQTARRQELESFLVETREYAMPTERLPLLVEFLEYGVRPEVLAEALSLASKIKSQFPSPLQEYFEKKKYVIRLREMNQ